MRARDDGRKPWKTAEARETHAMTSLKAAADIALRAEGGRLRQWGLKTR
ncbi:MAG: hypothetical protein ACLR56_08650 [Oscillospiraceae bacterium]